MNERQCPLCGTILFLPYSGVPLRAETYESLWIIALIAHVRKIHKEIIE